MSQRLLAQLDQHLAASADTTNTSRPEWHDPGFLSEATLDEKEAWLRWLLADESRLSHVDAEAYLVVLRALADPALQQSSSTVSPSAMPSASRPNARALPDAHLRAERWLVRLERHAERLLRADELSNTNDSTSHPATSAAAILPTAECYRCVLQAWANAQGEDPSLAVRRAERWLLKVLRHPTLPVQADTTCFNAFLDGCSKGRGLKDRSRGRHRGSSAPASPSPRDLVLRHADKAERALRYMVAHRRRHGPNNSAFAPDTDSFNYVIRAWTRCRTSDAVADRAMEALRLLEKYQSTVDPHVGPDAKSYAMVMDSLAVRAKLKVQRIRTKQHLWDDPSANGMNEVKLLHDILDYIEDKARERGDPSLRPNVHALNTLVSAWSHLSSEVHPHAPAEAEKVLQRMAARGGDSDGSGTTAPDEVTYRLVMRAWANSPDPHRGQSVARWLQRQWADYELDGREAVRPTVESYNMVMRVWADLGSPFKVEAALSDMASRSKRSPSDASLSPNSETYALLIRAWLSVADQGNRDALVIAVRWMDSLRAREEKDGTALTQVDMYSRILASARKCASQFPDVLDLAVETFDKLQKSHHPVDCIHYSRLLQVGLLALSGPENDHVRLDFVRQLVHDCSEQGLISKPFLSALANGPTYYDGWTIRESQRTVSELFPCWPFPTSWTRNVRQVGFVPSPRDLKRTNFEVSRHGVDPYK